MSIDSKQEQLIRAIEQDCLEGDVYLASALRATIDAIPVVGSTFTKILGESRIRNIFARLIEILREFSREIEELGEAKLDRAAIESEEFQSILAMVVRELEFTEEEEKLKCFKNILVHSVRADSSKDPNKKLYLKLVRDLEPEHIFALQRICARWPVSGQGHIGEFQALMHQWHPDRTRRVCNDLARYWLLNEVSVMDYDHAYQVTRHATDFIQFILDDNEMTFPRR